jgi:hypothetical protein
MFYLLMCCITNIGKFGLYFKDLSLYFRVIKMFNTLPFACTVRANIICKSPAVNITAYPQLFFYVLTSFYLPIVGVEGYCCT